MKQNKARVQQPAEDKVSVASLLKTSNPEEQAKIIQQLLQAAQAPVVSLAILADLRTGNLNYKLIGMEDPNYELIYAMLDSVRKMVFNEERQAAAAGPNPLAAMGDAIAPEQAAPEQAAPIEAEEPTEQ